MKEYLTDPQFDFIKYLTSLTADKNRGTLAALRRGLSGRPENDLELYRFITRRIPEEDRNSYREAIYYLVAALYASHPYSTDEGNFGDHLRVVASLRTDQEAAERRFAALLNTRLQDIHRPLRHAIAMLDCQQQKIPVHWEALFADLLNWNSTSKSSQRAWANGFWVYERPEALSTETDTTDDEQGE